MQFDKVETLYSISDLMTIHYNTGKPIVQIVKDTLKNKKDLELWRRSHVEYATLQDIEVFRNEFGYKLIVTHDTGKISHGTSLKVTHSTFFNDDGETEEKWKEYIGKKCLLYVGYSENVADGSSYRNLLDIEPI